MYSPSIGRRWPGSLRAVFAVCWLVVLSGCSLMAVSPETSGDRLSRESLTDFSLEGRFSLRQDGKSYAGRLSWQHAGANNDLVLSSPFGQGLAEILTREAGARLTTSDGQVYSAPDAESLTDQVLGYPLPLLQLTDWVRARVSSPTQSAPSDQTHMTVLDAFARPKFTRQGGWRIEYDYEDDDPAALPNLVQVERDGGFELRLRIDQWSKPGNSFEKGNQ